MPPRPLLVALLFAAGCSAPSFGNGSYDAASGVTRYESSAVPLGRSSSAGYASKVSLVLRAEAECPGEACAPSSYVVSIVNRGTNELAISFNQVVFSTPQGTVSFEPGRQTESSTSPVTFFNSGRGELVRISVPTDIFASFAASRTLSIRLGSQDYQVPYEARASLRRMLPGAE